MENSNINVQELRIFLIQYTIILKFRILQTEFV